MPIVFILSLAQKGSARMRAGRRLGKCVEKRAEPVCAFFIDPAVNFLGPPVALERGHDFLERNVGIGRNTVTESTQVADEGLLEIGVELRDLGLLRLLRGP